MSPPPWTSNKRQVAIIGSNRFNMVVILSGCHLLSPGRQSQRKRKGILWRLLPVESCLPLCSGWIGRIVFLLFWYRRWNKRTTHPSQKAPNATIVFFYSILLLNSKSASLQNMRAKNISRFAEINSPIKFIWCVKKSPENLGIS